MANKQVNIDSLNIHLSSGWQGDPVYLARKVSEQIQLHSAQLSSSQEIRIKAQGHFSGVAARVNQQLSERLNEATGKSTNPSRGDRR
ncbi:MAG: hypothetical protein ACJAZP_001365 [Psychromonas sp.]|jgi:hypothetical protein|uniref:hypothetical protein n=1 Tax=Psychromonas sp. TaxID=1884585 RepID=UPI0039E623A5